jgi:PAS domain S-box-containing protein
MALRIQDKRFEKQLRPFPLFELTQAVAAARRPEEIHDAALTCLEESLGVHKSSILLLDSGGVMRFQAWRNLSHDYRTALDGHSPWSPQTVDAKPVLVPDLRVEPSLSGLRTVIEAEDILALAFIPLASGGRLLGKFMLCYAEPHEFSADELLLAQTIASQVALAIDQKRARSQANHLDALYRSSVTGFAEIDLDSRFLGVNDRFCELVGRTRDELLRDFTCMEITHPDDREETVRGLESLARGEPHFGIEKRYLRSDQTSIWATNSYCALRDEDGRLQGAIVVTTDTTRRHRAEEVLRVSEQRFRELVQALDVAVYTTDADGYIQLYNEAAVEMWGRRPEIGKELWCGSFRIFRLDGSEMALDECPMAVTVKENRPVRGIEIVVERPDGSRATVLPHSTPMRDATGAMVGAVNLLVDVSDRKAAADRIARLNLDLLHRVDDLETLLNTAPIGIAVAQDPAGSQITLNPAAARMLGLDAGQNASKNGSTGSSLPFKVLHEGVEVAAQDLPMQRAAAENIQLSDLEYDVVGHDGEHRKLLEYASPLHDEAGNVRGSLGLFIDITERVRAESALKQSEERFQSFMQHLPAAAWIKDEEGRYIFANDEALRTFGTSREALYSFKDEDIFPAATALQMRENDVRGLATAPPTPRTETMLQEDGLHQFFIVMFPIYTGETSPRYVGGIGVDVTRERQAEKLLARSEERYKHLFESASVSLWEEDFSQVKLEVDALKARGITDIRTYLQDNPDEVDKLIGLVQVRDVNAQTMRLFEASSKYDLLGSLTDIFAESTAEAFIEEVAAVFEGRSFMQAETTLKTIRGREFTAIVSIAFPENETGFDSVLVSLVDISERYEAELRLREASELKDQFLGLVSHELRTPIATILGNALLLTRRADKLADDDKVQAMADIVSEGSKLQRIIENLLLLTRMEAGPPQELEPIRLPLLVSDVVASFSRRSPGRQIDVEIGADVPLAVGETTLLTLTIENLLSNADKYSPAHQPIHVLVLKNAHGQPEVCVRDFGDGVDESELAEIFTPFYRSNKVSRSSKGMGLGLAICKRVVEAQGGRITAFRRDSGGSDFVVSLAAAQL